MKTTLSHLPQDKADFLMILTELIVREASKTAEAIAYVILFGSYARGDWVHESTLKGQAAPYVSDYDIMIIPQNPCERKDDLWYKLKRKIEQLRAKNHENDPPWVSLFIHHLKFFNKQLQENEYFYVDVKREGIILYDSGQHQLVNPKELTELERANKAQANFDYWYNKSLSLLSKIGLAAEADLEMRKIEAFLLHQVAESLYTAALLVYTSYKPKTHDIRVLHHLITDKEPKFSQLFAKVTTYDRHLLKLLQRAYIDARYSQSYQISVQELENMRAQVLTIQYLVKALCADRISYLKSLI